MQRWRWCVRGQVQGVGFRPWVYRLAVGAGVTGLVRNDADGVTLEVQGEAEQLRGFAAGFERERPALAEVRAVSRETLPVVMREEGFRIEASAHAARAHADVTIDTAVCGDCLRELGDPSDRRFGHALINCTQCGPRLSIVRSVPYDRANTTMAEFVMCPACEREYGSPADRRFHAEPVCCPKCGPVVSFETRDGETVRGVEAVQWAARELTGGGAIAIKGLGGFHLAVRADDGAAVRRLRERKRREEKPFALMAADLAAALRLAEFSEEGRRALVSARAPIVLAQRRHDARVAEAVAPGCHRLGIMLPYTPLHHLLMRELRTLCPTLDALVMTSGNQRDEPLAISNAEARERLAPLCEGFLWHDRPIERCVDDSVVLDRGSGRQTLPLRRSRGFAPEPMALVCGDRGVSGVCVGADLKNTVAVVREGEVILSQHLGDLENVIAFEHFQRAIDDLLRLFAVRPAFVACDAHPAYLSAQYAVRLAQHWRVPRVTVQHHHAHAAALLAEHGVPGDVPTLVLACDGTGYGLDGTTWGGELLLMRGAHMQRVGRVKPMRLAGGDAAARDTRRAALSMLHQAYGEVFAEQPVARRLVPADDERQMLAAMIERGTRSPWSSSTGRLFDGAAALLGVCLQNTFEAQAGQTLESLAHAAEAVELDVAGTVETNRDGLSELNLAALTRWLVEGVQRGEAAATLARGFHVGLANGLAKLVDACAGGVRCVGLTGGAFCNALLSELVEQELVRRGYGVLTHQRVPANDGGIALGQAAVAVQQVSGTPARSDG